MATIDVDRWRWLWTSSVSSCRLTNSAARKYTMLTWVLPSICLSSGLSHFLCILLDMNFPLHIVCSRKWKDMHYPLPNQPHSILCWVLGKSLECLSITKCHTRYLSPGCVSLSWLIGNNIESIIGGLAINIYIIQWSIPRLRLIGCTSH